MAACGGRRDAAAVARAALLACLLGGALCKQVYIVHLDKHLLHDGGKDSRTVRRSASEQEAYHAECVARHDDLLMQIAARPSDKVASLSIVTNGFVARLSEAQAAVLQEMEGVVSVEPDVVFRPHTTYAPFFLGLNDPSTSTPPGLWSRSTGRGVVVGILDTGIWPEDSSFSDEDMPPPPAKFSGTCEVGTNWSSVTCNNKIIGARYFPNSYDDEVGDYGSYGSGGEFRSARDPDGHGSHVASIAAGSMVQNASIGSVSFGASYGIAFSAHISVYKVCFGTPATVDSGYYCYSNAIYRAFETAISDNVDVISASLGGKGIPATPDESPIDRGARFAALYGIPTVVSAGNAGPSPRTVYNAAPWYLSVAATSVPSSLVSTYDSTFSGSSMTSYKYVYTGNYTQLKGYAMTNGTVAIGEMTPLLALVYGVTAAPPGLANAASYCNPDTLDSEKVRGKIVLCDRGGSTLEQGYNVLSAGGAGMILREVDTSSAPLLEYHVLPAIHVDYATGLQLLSYVQEEENPTASISDLIQIVGSPPLPEADVASFSSRGPHPQQDILKPDISAPGVYIIGAWTQNPGANRTRVEDSLNPDQDPRTAQFAIVSGTSMSCPHVSGTVALLKALHPDWSPGAIYSAILTTAHVMNTTPFAAGHGLVNPNAAADPGLVYDARAQDYALFLCQYSIQMSESFPCSSSSKSFAYNAPSVVMSNVPRDGFITIRRVTNKGPAVINYTVNIEQPKGVLVTIIPKVLKFTEENEELNFTVQVVGLNNTISSAASNYSVGKFTWTSGDGKYVVPSPIIVSVTGFNTSVYAEEQMPPPSPIPVPVQQTPLGMDTPPPPNSQLLRSPPESQSPISFPPAPSKGHSRWHRSRCGLLGSLGLALSIVLLDFIHVGGSARVSFY